MSYPDGTPIPQYHDLEVAHDLLAGALASVSAAMGDADEWNQYRETAPDEGIMYAQACEQARVEAVGRVMDACTRLYLAGGESKMPV